MELARPGDLRLDPVALNDVVSEALQQVASQFTYRKIAVDVALAEGLPAVALDRKRFKQALLNVLVNASEALHTGGRVVVKTLAVPPASVAVEISDDGVGIPPEIIDRVFEPFVSTKREGVGLGLVNVRAVVEGHGGRISLESQPGRGTRARIVLPVKAHG
jgi:signal transduction histidine kinase